MKIINYIFPCLKSYGDFVILLTCLRDYKNPYYIYAGNHLKDLCQEFTFNYNIIFFDTGSHDVPSLFNIKNDGFFLALKSFFKIRFFLKNNACNNSQLVFDKLNFREKLLGKNLSKIAIKSKTRVNIYYDYQLFLKINLNYLLLKNNSKNFTIFPESRDKLKVLPRKFVNILIKFLISKGFTVQIFLNNSNLSKYYDSRYVHINKSSFNGLVKAIKNTNIISSDSLPGHLAEYFQKPNFIFLSSPNSYWLPYSCYNNSNWDEFYKLEKFEKWIFNLNFK